MHFANESKQYRDIILYWVSPPYIVGIQSQEQHFRTNTRTGPVKKDFWTTAYLKWSCKATLKSNASPRSPKPTPMKALRPADEWHVTYTMQCWLLIYNKQFGVVEANIHILTVVVLYPQNKISTGITNCFHCNAWVLLNRGLGKQLPYRSGGVNDRS